ncbi:MAG: type II toxin-antitoxin system TacA family antitoxin [Gemmataceae bacterium]
MSKPHPRGSDVKETATRSLVVRLDEESKAFLAFAAKLRGINVSDYVREVTVAQARREVRVAEEQQILTLSPQDHVAFWTALNETPRLTKAQKRLGSMMREGTPASR